MIKTAPFHRWLLLCLLVLLAGCAATQASTITPTEVKPSDTPLSPTETHTPPPTATPRVTHTPLPTIVIPILTQSPTPTPDGTPIPTPFGLPQAIMPEPVGVEIHFTYATAWELDKMAAAGIKWVRMDLRWNEIEIDHSSYDWSAYDALVESMSRRGMRIVFILDYGNPLYDGGLAPTSETGISAFARFAAVAAKRYQGKGIIWDIWNEPDLDHFWLPGANAEAYGRLALATAKAIREADHTALVAAPALSGYDWAFFRTLGEMGLYDYLDAVTVHSYSVTTPEAIIEPYLKLRALISQYSTASWDIPIYSGEWGVPATLDGMGEGQQAEYVTRYWLYNAAHGIHLSIWYDWHDDGPDRYANEQNYGLIRHDYSDKEGYVAAKALGETLEGYQFQRIIPLERDDDYLLMFQRGTDTAFAVWTTGERHSITLPLPIDDVKTVSYLGEEDILPGAGHGLDVPLTQAPRYLLFRADQAPALLGGWRPSSTVQTQHANLPAGITVVFDANYRGPVTAEVQVRLNGRIIGRADVPAPNGTEQKIFVPIEADSFRGNLPAEVVISAAGQQLQSMQHASIWLVMVP